MNLDFSLIEQSKFFQRPVFSISCDILLYLAAVLAFGAILINFLRQPPRSRVLVRRRSLVETASMTAFLAVFLVLCLNGIGRLWLSPAIAPVLAIFGLALIYGGVGINLIARLNLGNNWANQIQINQGQFLVERGLYAWVRHPLYASTILMYFGLAVFFQNPLVFALNALAFIPFMLLRVRQEEAVLINQFKDYANYRRRVGCFFPKFTSNLRDAPSPGKRNIE